MSPALWQQVSTLFSDCLQRSPVGRELLLSNLERSEPDVVREVRELLATYENDREFLESPAEQQLTGDALRAAREPEERPAARRAWWQWLKERPGPFRWMVAIELVALILYVWAIAVVARYSGLSVHPGWNCELVGNDWRVDRVDRPGPAAGIIETGDVILSFNDGPVRGGAMLRALNELTPGQRYSMRVLRNGVERDVTLVNEIVAGKVRFVSLASYLLVSIAFFIAAVVIGALKPAERITQLAWAALITEALTLLECVVNPSEGFLTGVAVVFHQMLTLVDGPHFAIAYHFYTRLFAPNPRKRSITIVLFYIVACSTPLIRILVFYIADATLLTSVLVAESAFYVIAPLAICATVLRNYLTVTEADAHRRLRWVVLGSLCGILPYAMVRIFGVVVLVTDLPPAMEAAYGLALGLAIIPAALIPFSTGYAILKHRLFDIDVVLRRGVQYLLARNMLRVILLLPVAGLLYALVRNAHHTVADVALHNGVFIAAVALIALVLRYRDRLSRWLDRKFFRESYRREHVLMALIDNVKKLNSVPDMCRQAGVEIMAALHPESISIFHRARQEKAFIAGFSSDARMCGIRLAEGSSLVSMAQLLAQPESVTFLRKRFGEAQACRWLGRMTVDLIVPMVQTDSALAGLMLLGRKKSDEPYTVSDRSLLAAVAEQMGIVCENLSLQERLHHHQETARQLRSEAGLSWLLECPTCGQCFDSSEARCSQDGTELVSSLPIARLLEGRYRLDRALGRGGMGVVYRAWDVRLQRDVAVKLLLPGKLGDSASLRRFAREAQALARISHPNIVGTHDFGVIDGEVAWMVMEFVPGSTLRSTLSGGSMRSSFVPHWVGQLLDGVHAAHQAGIVHRDLKPENILVTHPIDRDSQLKIADFGIAAWSAPDLMDSTLTVPGTLLGSVHYMSPEQLTGDRVDARADIFSAGVIIFEIVAGRLPFRGNTPAERIVSIVNDQRRFESELPGAVALHRILDRCLAKDPGQRYESAAALKSDLIPVLASSIAAAAP